MNFPLNSISKVSKNNWSLIVHCGLISGMLFKLSKMYTDILLPASMAQLDARPTGDKKVAGSTPAKVSNII